MVAGVDIKRFMWSWPLPFQMPYMGYYLLRSTYLPNLKSISKKSISTHYEDTKGDTK